MEQIWKIISFVVGAVISILMFRCNNYAKECNENFLSYCRVHLIFCKEKNRVIYHHVKYKDSIIFKEKQLEEGRLPIFVQPADSDKINFMMRRERKSFEELMIKYLYVPVEEEGLIYALIASNQFKIKEAESYIYRYLTRDSIGEYTYNLGIKHLKKGVTKGDAESLYDYSHYKKNK